MFRMKYIGVLLGVLVAGGIAQAGNSATGTAGAQELRIPVGARSTALLGSNLGDVSGVEAIFWNPGGLTGLESSEASFGNYQYWADMEMVQFSAAHNFGDFGTMAISARLLNLGDLYVTTEAMPDGTGEVIQPKFTTVTFSWARQLTDRVSLGANMSLLSEKIKDMSAQGFAMDFGVQVDTPMEGLKFGIVLKNFGPDMTFDGYGGQQSVYYQDDQDGAASRKVAPIYQQFELPSSFQAGLAYEALANPLHHLSFYGTFQSNHHSSDEYRFGTEYSFQNTFFARAGYVIASQLDDTMDEDYLYSWGTGLGFKVDLGANNMYLDWSYNPTDMFDATQWYTIRFEF